MGAAFEVNRQMCDLEIDRERWDKIGKEWASKKKEIVECIFKGNDMEKKKMTKAEAFEYLKHRKVAVVGDTFTIQNKLFEIGYTWCDGTIKVMPMVDLLLIDDETFQFTESLSHFKNCAYGEISADDILSIEIIEELEFNYDKAVELAKPLMHYLSETGHTEVISVCKEGISAIPMGTFLYKG